MNLTCQRCNHYWNYKGGQDYYTNCPRCMAKVKLFPTNFIGEEEAEDYDEDEMEEEYDEDNQQERTILEID